MGRDDPPYKRLRSMPTNHFAFVTFSLLRLVPFTNPFQHVKELLP